MPNVFISYVRDNSAIVDKLADELRRQGVNVWLDREQIRPGEHWQDAIRKAIDRGDFFIACFSSEYEARHRTYMNTEVGLAIEILQQMPTDRIWFIPVLISDCEIPDRDIGGGATLKSLHWEPLYKDWESGIRRILMALGRTALQIDFSQDLPPSPISRKSIGVSSLHVLNGHTGPVFHLAFSPDGRTLASAGGESTIRLWDTAVGVEVQQFRNHVLGVSSIAFSPNGLILAEGSMNYVWLRSVATGQVMQRLEMPGDNAMSLAFSPNGELLATVGERVLLWDTRTGQRLAEIGRYPNFVNDIAFSPDGRYLAFSADNLCILNLESRRIEQIRAYRDRVISLAFNPDGRTLACGGRKDEEDIRIIDVETRRELRSYAGHAEGVYCLAYSPDGSILASGGGDKKVRFWNAVYGRELARIDEHAYDVTDVVFSANGHVVATAGSDQLVRVWQVQY